MATGWQQRDVFWYYFYSDGSMACGRTVDGYYLGSKGKMATSEGWVNTDENNYGTWYYVGSDEKVVNGWNKIGDDFYYFYYPDGSMTWDYTIDGFDLDNDGKMVNGTGWLQDGITENWYYFSDGVMVMNNTADGYLFDNSGKMVTGTGWQSVNGDWYYLNDDKEATGWLRMGELVLFIW